MRVHMLALPVLAALAAGPASANQPEPAAADQTYGMALLYALVSGDGSLSRSAGAVSASPVTSMGPGAYEVTFNRPMDGCGYFVSPQVSSDALIGSTELRAANPNGVLVHIRDTSGALTTSGFRLLVFCPQ